MVTRYFTVFIFVTSAYAALRCKCIPGDLCFPTSEMWNALARNLSQPLIVGQRPLAAPCYPNSLEFSTTACSLARRDEFDHGDLAADSNGLQWTNWEELVTETYVYTCPYDPLPNATCHQGRVPSYSINVTTVSDIQHTILFATEHNLHLVVKNTGCAQISLTYEKFTNNSSTVTRT